MSKLVVVSGPSGVGKGTIVRLLEDRYNEEERKMYISISCTTREAREGEVDGVHYYFISEEEFLEKIENHDFLEYNKYGTGKYYGTPKSTVLKYLDEGYDVILEIDVNGYRQIKENFPSCIGVFIAPPSLEMLEKRLRDRGTETEESIEKRLNTAKEEMKTQTEYDYVIINEDGKVEEATEELYQIMVEKRNNLI